MILVVVYPENDRDLQVTMTPYSHLVWPQVVPHISPRLENQLFYHTSNGHGMWEPMGLLPDTQNCGLCMRRECRECFPRHRHQRKPIVSDPGMHHGTCVTHVSWCMSGSLSCGGGENVPGIPSACTTHNLMYLVRGPCGWYWGAWRCVYCTLWPKKTHKTCANANRSTFHLQENITVASQENHGVPNSNSKQSKWKTLIALITILR